VKTAAANGKAARSKPAGDRRLVDRCLAGETTAWSELYQDCHPKLLAAVRTLLGSAGQDFSLVDEVAARVWYGLVKDGGALLSRFDDGRGCRLTTFVSSIAKREIKQFLRSEKRRLSRERKASRSEIQAELPLTALTADFQEQFLDKLTRSERTYFDCVLVPSAPAEVDPAYSADNRWQLQHRVRKKLEAFLTDTE
jgi:DNA-directed RNA polymerase specialized sigma24 family protein